MAKPHNRIQQPAPKGGKHIAAPEPILIATNQRKPLFSLEYLSKSHCITKCEMREQAAFARTLHTLSQYTWQELRQAGRHNSGCEKIARKSIRAPIPAHLTDEVDFLAFRFYDRAPMVGYKSEEVFYVIWLDRRFDLYDHG